MLDDEYDESNQIARLGNFGDPTRCTGLNWLEPVRVIPIRHLPFATLTGRNGAK